MNSYTLINDNGEILGTTTIVSDSLKTVTAPLKPLREKDSARWGGSKWVYQFDKSNLTLESYKNQSNKNLARMVFDNLTRYVITNLRPISSGKAWKKEPNDKVAILIPCYEKADYIVKTVESCINQTAAADEIHILLMDEDSIAMKSTLEKLGKNVICHVSERMNASAARNYLFTLTSAEWIIFLDADDTLSSNFIEVASIKECAVCFPSIYFKEARLFHDGLSKNSLQNILRQNMTSFMRRDVFLDMKFNEDFASGGEDLDYMLRLLEEKRFLIRYEPEIYYNWLDGIDGQLTSKKEFCSTWIKVLQKHKDFLISELENAPFVEEAPLAISMLQNLSEENYQMLSDIKCTKCDAVELEDIRTYSNNIHAYIEDLADKSRQKDTEYVYNKDEYISVGDIPDSAWDMVEGRTFDCIILRPVRIGMFEDVESPSNLIVRKDIYDKAIGLGYRGVDLDIYLLENYSSFLFEVPSLNHNEISMKSFEENVESKVLIPDTIKNSKKQFDLTYTSSKKPFQKVSFIIDRKCNESCEYCFFRYDKKTSRTDEEIYEDFDRCITFVENLYGDRIYPQVLGGEPTIWSDWLTKKICDRVSKYHLVALFTNGTNKKSLFYEQPNFLYFTHLVHWKGKKATDFTMLPGELFNICVKKNEINDVIDFFDVGHVCEGFYLQMCQSDNPDWQITSSDILRLSEKLGAYMGSIGTTNAIKYAKAGGDDLIRKQCATSGVWNVDCEQGLISPCCGYNNYVPLDKFNPAMKRDCSNCLNIGNLNV